MKKKKRILYEWALFTKAQRNGVLIFLLLLNLIILFRVYYSNKSLSATPQETQMMADFSAFLSRNQADTLSKKTAFISKSDKSKIPQKTLDKKPYKKNKTKKLHLNINTADSNSLIQVKGIGPFYARGIIKYRKLLGGYYTLDQLAEVYGMRKKNLKMIRNQVYISSSPKLQTININTANFKTILRHPYTTYELTKEIFHHRNQGDTLTDIHELRAYYAINDSIFQKLKAYFRVK